MNLKYVYSFKRATYVELCVTFSRLANKK